mmetsp:Transcript_89926/g.142070  ORF Transcript_89926/g.142070 Transcript_89926/m.142070 type:complete len:161 (+) Transcript_89926:99-581(+)|eukprot:CAMPEP_0169085372 /NCGR_PEP_ID=MMETSP1015-20121227/13122_1 /TAXON_ID=342587 /ORGANISM="Karlodinium micrum, Strain CCMP2283" /LENGTH=160 /DNA_ID=CAMNT_0009145449 /DNA_START=82 /DNA_END=564 /DNA_ORIENTATION=+
MLMFMASSPTPAQYWPKFFGIVAVACSLSGVFLQLSPAPAAKDVASLPSTVEAEIPAVTAEAVGSSSTHKPLMRREPKKVQAPIVRPAEWGRLMRREAPLVPPMLGETSATDVAQFSRAAFLLVFGAVALVGFALQAKGALSQLAGLAEIQKYFGLKDAK